MFTTSPAPLEGVRVLDASRVLAGPFCGQLLGDLGAEVVKIERPGSGDETRGWGPPFVGDLSAYFLSCNRNKQSVTLDLGRPEGVAILHRLVEQSDIVLENFRADSAARLGLSPERLLAVNPRVIVCSISGFGRDSAWRDRPGYDFAIQALSGLMSITGEVDGAPMKTGVALTDVLTGLYAAAAVLACLHARQTTGHGYAIDLALLDCAVAAQVNVAQAYLATRNQPARQGNAHLQIVPYQLFATADGWLVVAVGNDSQWQRFCAVLERADLAADPRYTTNAERVRHRAELVPLLAGELRTRSSGDWQERLERAGVPTAPVAGYADLFAHPHAAERGLQIRVRDPHGEPVDLLGNPLHIAGATLPPPRFPPRLGEQTDAILKNLLGLADSEIAELRRSGVV